MSLFMGSLANPFTGRALFVTAKGMQVNLGAIVSSEGYHPFPDEMKLIRLYDSVTLLWGIYQEFIMIIIIINATCTALLE